MIEFTAAAAALPLPRLGAYKLPSSSKAAVANQSSQLEALNGSRGLKGGVGELGKMGGRIVPLVDQFLDFLYIPSLGEDDLFYHH